MLWIFVVFLRDITNHLLNEENFTPFSAGFCQYYVCSKPPILTFPYRVRVGFYKNHHTFTRSRGRYI